MPQPHSAHLLVWQPATLAANTCSEWQVTQCNEQPSRTHRSGWPLAQRAVATVGARRLRIRQRSRHSENVSPRTLNNPASSSLNKQAISKALSSANSVGTIGVMLGKADSLTLTSWTQARRVIIMRRVIKGNLVAKATKPNLQAQDQQKRTSKHRHKHACIFS